MSNKLYAFLITIISGFSTLLGFLFIYIKNKRENIISNALGFASGVMITISIIDLLPNSFFEFLKYKNKNIAFFLIILFILLGILISGIINSRVESNNKKNLKLYKLGIITMFTIILHNIPEGIVTYITTTNNIKLGILFSFSIALHNIPEGISISIPIYYSTGSKLLAFLYTFVSALSEPLGAIITYLFLYKYINNLILGSIYAIIAGMMINISINDLFKESLEYNKKHTIIYFIIGIIIMLLSHLLFVF